MSVKPPLSKGSVMIKHPNISSIPLGSNSALKLSFIKTKPTGSSSGILVKFYIIIAGDPNYRYLAV